MLGFRVVSLVDDDVHEGPAGQFLVQARGGEIHISGHILPIRNQDLAEDILGAAALMGRHRVAVAVIFLHRVAQAIEIAASRVRFVPQHQPGPLLVAHVHGAQVLSDIKLAFEEPPAGAVVPGRYELHDHPAQNNWSTTGSGAPLIGIVRVARVPV